MKKLYKKFLSYSILYLAFSISINAQEICNNGIDDDSDGLVDLNDANDCVCNGIGGSSTPSSLIPNPSFEDMACCPTTYSQVNCAQGWIQATQATSDYFNCGYNFGAATAAGLVPYPNGSGALGAIFSPGWQEYVGSCLLSPLVAGTQYTLQFNIASSPIDGWGNQCNGGVIDFGNIDITIFGSNNCSSMPISTTGCPPTNSGWDVLSAVNYTPVSSWGVITFTFTPTQNINAIIIGSPCTLPASYSPPSGCYPYFYYDNLILNTSSSFSPISVTPSGDICQGTAVATATAGTPGGTWQWYYNGVAIVGQTSSTLNVSTVGLGAGDYTAMYTLSGDCDVATTTFVGGAGDPTITPAGPFCANSGTQTLTAATSGGTWTASCGACINSSTGVFNPASATVGNNTITYTLGGSCPAVDNITIVVENPILNGTTVTDVSCSGACDGQIVINSTGASQFSIDGGATFQASSTFSNLCAGTYNIVITSANCQATGTATVQTPTALTLPTSFVDETCNGSCDGIAIVAPQGGTSPYNYSWSNGAGNSPTNNNLCAGNYTVTVTDDNGCNGSAVITISSPPPVAISSVTVVDESCNGACDGSITINATGTQFSIDGGSTFQASNVFNNLCGGNYSLQVEDANGCPSVGNATVASPPAINITPGASVTICIGQSATVSANASGGSGTLTYTWDNGLPSNSSNTVTPTTTTTYNVFVTDGNGCTSSTVQVTVTVNPPLQVVAQSDQSICQGENAVISATASGGNGGPYTYVWDDGMGNQLSGATQTVSPSATTVYTVTATDNCGTPSITDQVTITVSPDPVVTFISDTPGGCMPVIASFANTTNAADVGSCFWDFGNGNTSTDCNPTVFYPEPGCYDVSLTVTSPAGCIGSSTVNDMICVYPYPTAAFSVSPQPTDLYNTDILFTNESSGADVYYWDFGIYGSSVSSAPGTIHFIDSIPGTYPVCLIVSTVNGCSDTVCQDVVIDDVFILFVPNSFTPDNDQVNDLFYPVISGHDEESYEFLIFNRWGELIFQSTTSGEGWDGTHRSLNCKEDTYVWKLNVKDPQMGKKRTFVGHVNLLR